MTYKSNARSGIAMLLAIFLIGFVALALAGVGAMLTMQIRRTAEVQKEAQLRQLLLAGAAIASERLNSNSEINAPVPLPQPLADSGAALQLTSVDLTAGKQIHIHAMFENAEMADTLSMANVGGHWQIVEAALDR